MTRPSEWPAIVKLILTLIGLVAGTVVFAYTNFETHVSHTNDVIEVKQEQQTDRERVERALEHIDRDLHEILQHEK